MSQTKNAVKPKEQKKKKLVSSMHANSKVELSEYFHPGRSFPNTPVSVAIHIDKATTVKIPSCVDKAFFFYKNIRLFLQLVYIRNSLELV